MLIRVKVYSNTKRDEVKEIGENRFEIYVKVPANENLANQRMRELVAGRYQVKEKQVRIISGHHKPQKILSVMVEDLLE